MDQHRGLARWTLTAHACFELTRRGIPDAVIVPPRDRGRLLFPEDVKEKYFKRRHSIAWIKRHVARHSRIRIGTTSAWFERDVDAWLETLRPGAR